MGWEGQERNGKGGDGKEKERRGAVGDFSISERELTDPEAEAVLFC